jgi:ketosteroid isomerase-like protein
MCKLSVLAAPLALALCAGVAWADAETDRIHEDRAADLVIVGRPLAVHWAKFPPSTTADVAVEQVLKGSAAEAVVVRPIEEGDEQGAGCCIVGRRYLMILRKAERGAYRFSDGRLGSVALDPGSTAVAEVTPEQTVERFHAAIEAGDAAAAGALLAVDAVIYEQGGVERSKAAYLAEHLPADIGFAATTTEAITARRSDVSGDLAVVTRDGRIAGSFEGRTVDRAIAETMVLRRTHDGWRIAHVHWSSGK